MSVPLVKNPPTPSSIKVSTTKNITKVINTSYSMDTLTINQCDKCQLEGSDEYELGQHKRNDHAAGSALVTPPPKKTQGA